MKNIDQLLGAILPADSIKTRLIDRLAAAADASFYQLIPQAVVLPATEEEVRQLFHFSAQHRMPLVFRAGGTSLSGQAITDGLLVDVSRYWRSVRVEDGGKRVRVQPGVTGGLVNKVLKPHGRKIGPDPASIDAAMMGGILSNNASGMCCGVRDNAYHTMASIKFMLPTGQAFNTALPEDHERFRRECSALYHQLLLWRDQIAADTALQTRIRRKYRLKNTVGYALNAFIDHQEPLDILAHLMIGAEGTLGFIAEAVLNTIPDQPHKATGVCFFRDIEHACSAIVPLTNAGAAAIELMDRPALRSIEHQAGVPPQIATLPDGAAALLVEFQQDTPESLKALVEKFELLLPQLDLLHPANLTTDAYEIAALWKIRKGMFPSVGAVRKSGTSVILEDIAFPPERLGPAITDLQKLLANHGYTNAIIFGHAREGNIHFVVTQTLDTPSEVARYKAMMDEVVALVLERYDGSLKAEHGTGRNMAPFVEAEWGSEAYRIMASLKELADPDGLLNPGVIINPDPEAHLHNLKRLDPIEPEADRCIECGFCEHRCPSRDLTLTPRQRIVIRRALSRYEREGDRKAYDELTQQYQYDGLDTCAVDGMCATSCPVDINTGDLVKRLRARQNGRFSQWVALRAAKQFKVTAALVRTGVTTGHLAGKILGGKNLETMTVRLHKLWSVIPVWNHRLTPASGNIKLVAQPVNTRGEVIFFPTCIGRVMGTPGEDLSATFIRLSEKAGYKILIPNQHDALCCGQAFGSKGYPEASAYKANQAISKLYEISKHGEVPVVLDVSSCTYTLRHCRAVLDDENRARYDKLVFLDSTEYLERYILPHGGPIKKAERVVLHPVCAAVKMGQDGLLAKVAAQLAQEVIVPPNSGCCGMAGDRGFLFPELTHSATAKEAADVPQGCSGYYSTSRPCELALSDATGQDYQSILFLAEKCLGTKA